MKVVNLIFYNNHKHIYIIITFIDKFNDEEILQIENRPVTELEELPHTGSQCEPGKSYHVDCNRCLCTHKGDLACTFVLCMTIDSFERAHTDMLNGILSFILF